MVSLQIKLHRALFENQKVDLAVIIWLSVSLTWTAPAGGILAIAEKLCYPLQQFV